MIRACEIGDIPLMLEIINDAARAYWGVIPDDCRQEPYMAEEELRREIASGVSFWGYQEDSELLGVMGIQPMRVVTLIRHAYVRTAHRGRGIGSKLLAFLHSTSRGPVLVGTWAAATWAIAFYEKHGFRQVTSEEKDRLLRAYWTIPDRQIETSVVLVDAAWRQAEG